MTRHAADPRAGQGEPGNLAGTGDSGDAGDAQERELTGPDLLAIERAALARWEQTDRSGRPTPATTAAGTRAWACWSEPLAAAGLPGLHDVPGLVVSDCYLRLKAMQGFDVSDRTAVDGHGLAVEVAVERELGLAGPLDVERYGVDRFTARCREYAGRHAAAFAALRTRLGCRPASRPLATMDLSYIESAWRSLRRILDAGLLERAYRITPYCPRCQTPLSWHDLAQPGARPASDGSGVIVRCTLASLPDGANPRLRGADLLAWTSKPWMLAANAAIAVHPHQTYALARRAGHDDRVIVAEHRLVPMLGDDWHAAARFSGADLAGATYDPPLDLGAGGGPRPVLAGYFVPQGAGTGLMPLAPAFGADDLETARAHDLPVRDPIASDGRFMAGTPLVGGAFFADASRTLIAALSDAGALVRPVRQADGDPRCWRCGTPVFTRAMAAWHLRAPAGAGQRDADADWMISRSRYWGTPLPLWECQDGHVTCAESLAHLSELAGDDLSALDLHRPQIDGVIIGCPRCGGPATRIPDVLDARYDAGWLLFAGAFPPARTVPSLVHRPRGGLVIAGAGPGSWWLQAVRDVGAAVYGRPPDSRVLALEPVQDASGRAMSRELGNVVDPMPLIERFGADATRWCCVTGGSAAPAPGTAALSERALSEHALPERALSERALSDHALSEVIGTVFTPYWRAAVSALRLAEPGDGHAPLPGPRTAADDELLAGLRALTADVTASFDELRPALAGAHLAGFLADLTHRYLPAARERLAAGGHGAALADAGPQAAAATMVDCVQVLTRLMAPIAPLITDEVWGRLRAAGLLPGQPDSVHLASWPVSAYEPRADRRAEPSDRAWPGV